MARIAGIDIPRNKKVSYSLRYIFGIGLTQAKNICDKAGVDQNIIVQNLSEDQVVSIRTAMTDLQVTVEGELRSEVAMNIKRLKDVGSYRGLRHRKGLPVNGQRTKTNARTRKGKRRTVGMGKQVVGKKG
ncbi:MAG TPA: 30S ribosomal protein S13 [Candidatus Marinimicrobia bacterium]|nr:30S ribosomal protein S13 [Candidatus Neomarinimicrobiota bacterium]HIN97082.1 30S ribosomal protein S13 [Candidatus Neomarinimicrobiota bacterium]